MGLRKDCSGDFHDRRVGRDDFEGDELGLVERCIGGVRETSDAFVLKGEVVVGAVLMACGSTEGGDSGVMSGVREAFGYERESRRSCNMDWEASRINVMGRVQWLGKLGLGGKRELGR